METFLNELEKKIGIEKIVEVLKQNEHNFFCAKW